MKSELAKYILIGFPLGVSLMLFFGGIGEKSTVGRFQIYEVWDKWDGDHPGILDTRTGKLAVLTIEQGDVEIYTVEFPNK